ncbi:MAG: phosphoribosylglycinamide formyltransferase [Candidatus Omnitrophota bacterium]
MNIAIFCSGFGSNLQAIINAKKRGYIKANLRVVISDNKHCYALTRAKRAGIETLFVNPKLYKDRKSYDREVIKELRKRKIQLVVLAGFMRLLSRHFVRAYKNRILNVHPALLPSFKGTEGIKDALDYGVKVTGPSVHFVDEKLDHGPIIMQKPVPVFEGDMEHTLAERMHKAEHEIYPKAINLFVKGKLKIKGRKVKVL